MDELTARIEAAKIEKAQDFWDRVDECEIERLLLLWWCKDKLIYTELPCRKFKIKGDGDAPDVKPGHAVLNAVAGRQGG